MSSFIGKRKFSRDDDDDHSDYAPTKHVKTDASIAPSDEVVMSDAVNIVPFPIYAHSPLSISTSVSPNSVSAALPSASPSSAYPSFELYPEIEMSDVDMDASSRQYTTSMSSITSTAGPCLLQPSSNSFFRHGGNCTTIPRLRMASHAGLNGTRSMWSHCPECGAIEMVAA